MECNTVLSVASCGTYYRDATILQYIDIIAIFATAIQYNTPDKNIDILLIAIYCNIYCLQSCKCPIITLLK